MSLICTGIKESFVSMLKWRAMDLERAVRALLDDDKGQLSAYFFSLGFRRSPRRVRSRTPQKRQGPRLVQRHNTMYLLLEEAMQVHDGFWRNDQAAGIAPTRMPARRTN